eukprot:Rmarinus@m.8614
MSFRSGVRAVGGDRIRGDNIGTFLTGVPMSPSASSDVSSIDINFPTPSSASAFAAQLFPDPSTNTLMDSGRLSQDEKAPPTPSSVGSAMARLFEATESSATATPTGSDVDSDSSSVDLDLGLLAEAFGQSSGDMTVWDIEKDEFTDDGSSRAPTPPPEENSVQSNEADNPLPAAVRDIIDAQLQRREELLSYVDHLKTLTDSSGEPLVEFPDDFDTIVETMNRKHLHSSVMDKYIRGFDEAGKPVDPKLMKGFKQIRKLDAKLARALKRARDISQQVFGEGGGWREVRRAWKREKAEREKKEKGDNTPGGTSGRETKRGSKSRTSKRPTSSRSSIDGDENGKETTLKETSKAGRKPRSAAELRRLLRPLGAEDSVDLLPSSRRLHVATEVQKEIVKRNMELGPAARYYTLTDKDESRLKELLGSDDEDQYVGGGGSSAAGVADADGGGAGGGGENETSKEEKKKAQCQKAEPETPNDADDTCSIRSGVSIRSSSSKGRDSRLGGSKGRDRPRKALIPSTQKAIDVPDAPPLEPIIAREGEGYLLDNTQKGRVGEIDKMLERLLETRGANVTECLTSTHTPDLSSTPFTTVFTPSPTSSTAASTTITDHNHHNHSDYKGASPFKNMPSRATTAASHGTLPSSRTTLESSHPSDDALGSYTPEETTLPLPASRHAVSTAKPPRGSSAGRSRIRPQSSVVSENGDATTKRPSKKPNVVAEQRDERVRRERLRDIDRSLRDQHMETPQQGDGVRLPSEEITRLLESCREEQTRAPALSSEPSRADIDRLCKDLRMNMIGVRPTPPPLPLHELLERYKDVGADPHTDPHPDNIDTDPHTDADTDVHTPPTPSAPSS